MKTKTTRHKLIWFVHRIGQYVIKNGVADMLNHPIQIASLMNDKALLITKKEKG